MFRRRVFGLDVACGMLSRSILMKTTTKSTFFSLNQLFNYEIQLLQLVGTHISVNYGAEHGRGVHGTSTAELPENEAQRIQREAHLPSYLSGCRFSCRTCVGQLVNTKKPAQRSETLSSHHTEQLRPKDGLSTCISSPSSAHFNIFGHAILKLCAGGEGQREWNIDQRMPNHLKSLVSRIPVGSDSRR